MQIRNEIGEGGRSIYRFLRNCRGDFQPQVLLRDTQQEEQDHHDRRASRERSGRRHRVRGGGRGGWLSFCKKFRNRNVLWRSNFLVETIRENLERTSKSR